MNVNASDWQREMLEGLHWNQSQERQEKTPINLKCGIRWEREETGK